jgi:hypothetical protein
MAIANMSWSWKDDDGSGNIDQREFQSNLREYHAEAGQPNGKDFCVPQAGRNHSFFTPLHDPYSGAKSDAHYKQLAANWLKEDMREAGGATKSMSNVNMAGGGAEVAAEEEGSGRRRRSSRRSGRRGSASSSIASSRSRGAAQKSAGRTPWAPKLLGENPDEFVPENTIPKTMKLRYGHQRRPRHRSHKALAEARAAEMRPDPSFDVDGDGVVSAQDYFLANQFDVNGDKYLDDEERWELRKKMVKSVVDAYQKVPKPQNDPNKALLRSLTTDIDETVRRPDFVHRFNELYTKTSVSMTWDSRRLQASLQPFESADKAGARSVAGKKGGAALRTMKERDSLPHRLPTARRVQTSRSTDSLDLSRGPEWLQGGERYKWSGYASRRDLLKARKMQTRAVTDARVDRRMKEHIIERNRHGADLPMPRSWGQVKVADVSARYKHLDVNHDGLLSRPEFSSQASLEVVHGPNIY